jgi:adenine-specific DNA methylase
LAFEPLISKWFPATELGIECHREHSTGRHPPLHRLHVWWARRPLVLSSAAVLASLLPADAGGEFPSTAAYHAWFLRLVGVVGDPVAAQASVFAAGARRLPANPFGYPRAYTHIPSPEDLAILNRLLVRSWPSQELQVLDPMAGGGSIPFSSLRYGLGTWANELNPVAGVLLAAGLDYPARFGPDLAEDIEYWGKLWSDAVREQLEGFFVADDVHAYLWARTIICPDTGRPVPLSPNWWLRRGELGARIGDDGHLRIIEGHADPGTVHRGLPRSPWTGEVLDREYVRAEAADGRLGHQLWAVACKRGGRIDFRLPDGADLAAVRAAEAEFLRDLHRLEREDLIPAEAVPPGLKTSEPLRYGVRSWRQLFATRQVLVLCRALETLGRLTSRLEGDRGRAVAVYLALALDKAAGYNSLLCRWHAGRGVVAGTFDRHDFGFKWSYAEIDGARKLLPWAVAQVAGAYRELARLLPRGNVARLLHGDAARMERIPDGAVHLVCVDPPYYDNVMYAELSDFFYVWLRRSLRSVRPELFRETLTEKGHEAVVNRSQWGSRREADAHYRRRMEECFREMRRVLHPDGVLTMMFAHKRLEAWEAMAWSLLESGFRVRAAWPIHSESPHSLHHAGKTAVGSTVLLICSRRDEAGGRRSDGLVERVRTTTRAAVAGLPANACALDREVAALGGALTVLSDYWPTAEPDGPRLLAETLRLAREEATI